MIYTGLFTYNQYYY